MANILPDNMRIANKRRYFARLFAVSLYGISFIFVICIALTIPSYYFLQQEAQALSSEEEVLGEELKEDAQMLSLEDLSKYAAQLTSTEKGFLPTEYVETIINTLSPEIAVASISFQEGEKEVGFTISGVAATRESLVSFRDALEGLETFSNVDLPVTQLAKRTDLGFSISAIIRP